jgi:hypothetical protein
VAASRGVRGSANVRAMSWLGGGIVAYAVVESVLSPRIDAVLPAGGWKALGVNATMFIPLEIAGVLVAGAVLAELVAISCALMLWRGYPLSRDVPVDFAFVGAWVFIASWPLQAVFLFVRGNHVPGSPTGAMTTLVVASLLACQGIALWQVSRARRAFRALAD